MPSQVNNLHPNTNNLHPAPPTQTVCALPEASMSCRGRQAFCEYPRQGWQSQVRVQDSVLSHPWRSEWITKQELYQWSLERAGGEVC